MKPKFILLAAVIALYLVTSLGLHLAYGPSYPFLAGEDCWLPDGQTGWRAQGSPAAVAPSEPSINVPLLMNYLPIFLPVLFLMLFWLTPLRKILEPESVEADDESDTSPPEA